MSEPLFAEFPPVSTDEWLRAVHRDLKGNVPPGKLFHREEDLPRPLEPQPPARYSPWQIWAEVRDQDGARRAVSRGVDGLLGSGLPESVDGVACHVPDQFTAFPNDWSIRRQVEEARSLPASVNLIVPVSPSYCEEIAKFRALRRLCPERLLVARTSTWHETAYDAHVNLLRSTAEAMAAVAGGCDALIVGPFDAARGGTDTLAERMAINTQLLLREEASFGLVEDPAAGSYYLEALTAQLLGGTADWGEREAQVFIGANRYPNLNEKRPPDVTPHRATSAVEALRARTDSLPQRPVIGLTGASTKADVAFGREFLAAGGFLVTTKPEDAAALTVTVAELRVSGVSQAEILAGIQARLGMGAL